MSESPFSEIQHPKKRAFLTAYAACGNRGKAAAAAGIERNTIYSPPWRDDEQFQEALERAQAMAVDVLEEEALRRAVEGVERPIGWYRGQPGGFVREYSDALLIFLLKGAAPEKYRDRLDVRGVIDRIDFSRLTNTQLDRIVRGEHPMSVLAEAAEEFHRIQGQLPPGREVSPQPDAPPVRPDQSTDGGTS